MAEKCFICGKEGRNLYFKFQSHTICKSKCGDKETEWKKHSRKAKPTPKSLDTTIKLVRGKHVS